MQFRAPTFVQTAADLDSAEVRYWSINIGNDRSYVFNALKDEDCLIDSTGAVTIVMADKNEAIQQRCTELGFNFMEWTIAREKAFVIYRNMLTRPDFVGHFKQVQPLKEEDDFTLLEAKKQIGRYGPKGFRLSEQAFLAEFGE